MRGIHPGVPAALLFALAAWACDENPLLVAGPADGTGGVSTGGQRQTGGATATGGATGGVSSSGGVVGTGGAPGCGGAKVCGGNVVGTWTVASSCMTVSGAVDLSFFGLSCPAPKASGPLNVEGSWTAAADGTYKDETVTWGSLTFVVPPACLKKSGAELSCPALGMLLTGMFPSVSCGQRAEGGCDCAADIKHTGSIGTGRTPAAGVTGQYQSRGSIILVDKMTTYDVCAPAEAPTMTLAPHDPLVSGVISLRRTGN